MHEIGLIRRLFDVLEEELHRHAMTAVRRVRLRVGEQSGVVPEQLRDAFALYARGTFADGATLDLEVEPAEGACAACGTAFPIPDFVLRCPACGSQDCRLAKGGGLIVHAIEIGDSTNPVSARRITVRGTVQGVGFRPFVARLAAEEGLAGRVRNTPEGVEITVEGAGLDRFLDRLRREHPVHARIDSLVAEETEPLGLAGFAVEPTRDGESFVFSPPDLAMCGDCARELLAPGDRRHGHPFINCTNCGPRYTIIEALPYDRAKTTMRAFTPCAACASEYASPLDRRFHAEPVACPDCGPQLEFVKGGDRRPGGLDDAVRCVREGGILALKGLGGFHLICDPRNPGALARLRTVKDRSRKPFALMARGVEEAGAIAHLSSDERQMLESPQRPIVLLRKKEDLEGIAPGLGTYGVMLPYTPLHFLFSREFPLLVATSANLREGPILRSEEEGVSELADALLSHDRGIAMRCDDSVVRVFRGRTLFLRRARGYVPDPLRLPDVPCRGGILALGGELKNTISILKDGCAVTSQYLGDMKDLRNDVYLDEVLGHFAKLYSFEPAIVACDLHPQFTTTRRAERTGRPVVRVQHHVAHLFAVMAEHGLATSDAYFGVSFDGAGYGEDGHVWGGEFFALSGGRAERVGHLRYVPQPGGDLAAREPWRMALAHALDSTGKIPALAEAPADRLKPVAAAIARGVNCPLTSSAGRLFDAVSSLAGLAPPRIGFEAEAAIRLEEAADPGAAEPYPFRLDGGEIDVRPMIRAILGGGEPPGVIAARFHETLAQIVVEGAERARRERGVARVLLGGGVFLNVVLLDRVVTLLEERGFQVWWPVRFSPGDEGLSLGQVLFAATNGGGHVPGDSAQTD